MNVIGYYFGLGKDEGIEDSRLEIKNRRVELSSLFFGLFIFVLGMIDSLLLDPTISEQYANKFIVFGMVLMGWGLAYQELRKRFDDEDQYFLKHSYPGMIMLFALMMVSYNTFVEANVNLDSTVFAHLAYTIPLIALLTLMILPLRFVEAVVPMAFVYAVVFQLGYNPDKGITYKIDLNILMEVIISTGFVVVSQIMNMYLFKDVHGKTSTEEFSNLLTRFQFIKRANSIMSKDSSKSELISMVLVNLDDFKDININYGYSAGDKIISRVSEIIGSKISDDEMAAKYSGDEFAILLRGRTIEDVVRFVMELMEQIRKGSIVLHREDGGKTILTYSASIGISEWDGIDSLEALSRQANENVYASKSKGKDCASIDGIKVFK